ncbi:MAG: DUF333 domain-containing protein [Anaerolineae bacterium]|nr:DUF333 domain-containing protein [Anaerolineae bacterium]
MLIGVGMAVSCKLNQPAVSPTSEVGMPNPASVFCEQNGGKLDFVQDASGGVAGVCVFPDGSECEEWAYFRGECQPEVAAETLEPAAPAYMPVTQDVCLIIQELATQAVGLTFSMEANAPFTDFLTGETGQGCTLTAAATGAQLSDPDSVLSSLVDGMLGWTELPDYQANGPTGAATAMMRDMGLMLIRVEWTPSPEVQCPADQPISECGLLPEQKLYTVQIQAAMK